MHIEAGKNRNVPESKYREEATKGSARVIGFLREFNFGDPSMTAREAIDNLISVVADQSGKAEGKGPTDPQGIFPELARAIELGGFGHVEDWAQIQAALEKVVTDWESHDKIWQDEVSKYHQDYRF